MRLICAIIFSLVFSDIACAVESFEQAQALYKRGRYAQVLEMLPRARAAFGRKAYLSGNCRLAMGELDLARTLYRHAIQVNDDPEATLLSKEALAKTSAPLPKKESGNILDDRKPPAAIDRQVSEREERIKADLKLQVADFDALYKRQKAAASDRINYMIDCVPRYVEFGTRRVKNADFDGAVSAIRRAADIELNALARNHQRQVDEATALANGKLRDAENQRVNLKAEFKGRPGAHRMMPPGSGFYVRNYLNASGTDVETPARAPEEPLTARSVPMKQPQSVKPK